MRQGLRAIALALMAVGVAGCSAETTRFNDSPFASRQPEGAVARAPAGYIEQQPLPAPQDNYGNQNGYGGNYNTGPSGSYGSPQNGNYYQSQSAAPAIAGGGRGMVSYAPANASPGY